MDRAEKTISFSVDAPIVDRLTTLADEQDLSLSSLFREYAEALVEHDGRVSVGPPNDVRGSVDRSSYPPTVEVPTSYVREHERLELEATHLKERIEELNRHVNALQDKIQGSEEIVFLGDLDDQLARD